LSDEYFTGLVHCWHSTDNMSELQGRNRFNSGILYSYLDPSKYSRYE